jgi:lipopolysaccharide/colanic/teichoic acid biosynthesis glycosyltransferase
MSAQRTSLKERTRIRPPVEADAIGPAPQTPLSERYKEMAHEGHEHRGVDTALRAFDLTIAGATLVVLSPLLVGIAISIRLTSGSPVLYRGRRVGRAGRIFSMLKFRTLAPDAEARLGPYLGHELTHRTQTEVTRLGRVLRFAHLDELPQLWNVARGDMSIVGPRPIRPAFFEELCEQIPQYWQRLVVEPGMTGFAQLRMTRETSWAEKLAHDLEYVADRSVHLYLRVCVATAWRILSSPVRLFSR